MFNLFFFPVCRPRHISVNLNSVCDFPSLKGNLHVFNTSTSLTKSYLRKSSKGGGVFDLSMKEVLDSMTL